MTATATNTLNEREVIITRIIDAPRSLVFKAWTDPVLLAQWWGPSCFTNPVCEVDLRLGGAFRIVMRAPDSTEYPMRGNYREIVSPERLVFTNIAVDQDDNAILDGLTIVTFEELDGKTKLTVQTKAAAQVAYANQYLEGMEMGWTQSIDSLEEFVATVTQSPANENNRSPLQDAIDQAKGSMLQAKAQLIHSLETTPDDRLNWSPSPTARTPLQTAAHAANSIKNIHGILDNRPFQADSVEEADKSFREWELQFTTREQVMELIEQNTGAYIAWLDALTEDHLNSMVETPFGMGKVPVALGLTFPPGHTMGHVSQIEYIQTIYGDQDWHM
jgi:uncharacterized protein YndB with AHSA1/START domain